MLLLKINFLNLNKNIIKFVKDDSLLYSKKLILRFSKSQIIKIINFNTCDKLYMYTFTSLILNFYNFKWLFSVYENNYNTIIYYIYQFKSKNANATN